MAFQKFSTRVLLALVAVVALASNTAAFVPQAGKSLSARTPFSSTTSIVDDSSTTTQLAERQWNFNEGQSPWGMKTNAEKWNGRVAQVRFVSLCFDCSDLIASQNDSLWNRMDENIVIRQKQTRSNRGTD
jgi:hypothetical protein